jgi:hypothetical protein
MLEGGSPDIGNQRAAVKEDDAFHNQKAIVLQMLYNRLWPVHHQRRSSLVPENYARSL